MIVVRPPECLYEARVPIQNGMCHGRWHFSFDTCRDPDYMRFGTLSPGAVWPLHPHQEIEVVTYCAEGEFRHADEEGEGGVLQKGCVQHTTVGRGMWHSEINNRPDAPMRFLQMWFLPSAPGLEPSVEQRPVARAQRTDRWLPLADAEDPGPLLLFSDAAVFSSFVRKDAVVRRPLESGRGAYLLVVEGGPVRVDGRTVAAGGAAKVSDEASLETVAEEDAELLLVDTLLLEEAS